MKRALWCVAFGALGACSPGTSAPPDAAARPAPEHAGPAPLDVVAVVSRPLETTVHLEGEIEPYETVAVFPRVSGFVAEIPVDRGSVVHRGQLLVRVVAPELAAQRAEVLARLRADEGTYNRLRAAAQTPGVVAGNDLDLADAARAADRQRLRALGDLEGYLTLRAPFDGVITERNVHPGALVGPSSAAGTPLLRLDQVARLRLVVAVPEPLTGTIADGAAQSFAVRAWPQRTFTGTVRRLAHALDRRTRTMPVELDVENADGALAPGMFADVAWHVRRTTPSLFVPPTAIVATTEQLFVLRVQDGAAERVRVQRGMSAGDLVEVFGALAADELVARRGTEDVRPGARVAAHVVVPDGGGAGPR